MVFTSSNTVSCRGEEDGNYILFNSANGAGFLMNATSKAIFDCCDGTRDLPQIVSHIRHHYGGNTPPKIEEIVEAHLSLLTRTTLVRAEDLSSDN